MLLRIPKLLNEHQLAAVRSALDARNAPWVDGRVTAGYQGAPAKHNQQIEEASPLARELGNLIIGELERNALFISAVLPGEVYPPMFNRYAKECSSARMWTAPSAGSRNGPEAQNRSIRDAIFGAAGLLSAASSSSKTTSAANMSSLPRGT